MGAQPRRPTRYLYELPDPRLDDRRSISVTFGPGYHDAKRQLVDGVVQAINQLLELPTGWDANGAARVAELAALAAVEWLDRIVPPEAYPPHVVPLTDGGLQLEWIIDGQAFEIEAAPSGEVGVLGMDGAGNVIVDGELPSFDDEALVRAASRFVASLHGSTKIAW